MGRKTIEGIRCGECRKKYPEANYKTNPRTNKLYARCQTCRTEGKVIQRKRVVNDIKLTRGCENVNCQWTGSFTPEQLSFDHRIPAEKSFTISTALNQNKRLEEVLEEIKKCDVLCMNCHFAHSKREKHYQHSSKHLDIAT